MSKNEETISNSKEESIRKAILKIQQNELNTEKNFKRPDINVKKTIFVIIIIFILQLFIVLLPIYFGFKLILLSLFLEVILIKFAFKNLIINTILLYQKYAPEKLRKSCLFEPTCSNYMILSIKKYGVLKGTLKGIKRLSRCHSPNGGIDYP